MNNPVSNTGNNISKRTFSCASRHVELHIFLYSQRGIDSIKDEISKQKFTEMKSLLDRQYCTKGVFRVYRISIAILLLTQQRNFTINSEIKYQIIFFFFSCCLSRCTQQRILPFFFLQYKMRVFYIISFGLETEGQIKCKSDGFIFSKFMEQIIIFIQFNQMRNLEIYFLCLQKMFFIGTPSFFFF